MLESPERASPLFKRIAKVFRQMRSSGQSEEEIFIAVYEDLRFLARRKLAGRPAGPSMHATRLMSDLWVRLFGKEASEFDWKSAEDFFKYMSTAMEHLVVNYIRARLAAVRGGGHVISLEPLAEVGYEPAASPSGRENWNEVIGRTDEILSVHEALQRLAAEANDENEGQARVAERQREIVRLRFFVGLTEDETAAVLGCSSETVTKEFRKARGKLDRYLRG